MPASDDPRPLAPPSAVDPGSPDDRLAKLTPREREVLALIIEGKTNKAIGAALGIAEGTVKSHIRQMMLTLRVKTRTQIALLAVSRR